jgi:hypothetical protein
MVPTGLLGAHGVPPLGRLSERSTFSAGGLSGELAACEGVVVITPIEIAEAVIAAIRPDRRLGLLIGPLSIYPHFLRRA